MLCLLWVPYPPKRVWYDRFSFKSNKKKSRASVEYLFFYRRLRFRPNTRIHSAEEEGMNKETKRLVFSIALTMLVINLPAQMIPVKMCCIAGEYKGSQIHSQLPNCPVPKSETFTMTIFQARGCGADVWGKITSPSGEVNEFKGTLSRGPSGCCAFNASFGNPTHPGYLITLTGTFCQRLGKWHAKGTYKETNNSDPCKKAGSWELQQI
jgi:hypothetical protein